MNAFENGFTQKDIPKTAPFNQQTQANLRNNNGSMMNNEMQGTG
jgi:hypothetical protein